MSHPIRSYQPDDRAPLHALLRDPSLESEFGWLLDNGELDDPLRHPFGAPAGVWVAEGTDGLAAFAELVRFTAARGDWNLLRVAVRGAERRRGVGRALAERAQDHLREVGAAADAPLKLSHWDRNPAGEAFARALGFEPERCFWTMERPGAIAPEVLWPPGMEVRGFDFSEAAFEAWCGCYNVAFAENSMNVDATVDQCRMLTEQPHFDPSGLILVHRGDSCVGFCRCAVHSDHGDVDVLGVTPDARGIGLGRALLRWGVSWLITHRAPSVRLVVDGENERALGLYRSEGFEIVKTRRIWQRWL